MQHNPLIRTIYLYLFTIIGLALLVIGGVRFVDMGLKMFIFTKAEADQQFYNRLMSIPYPLETMESLKNDEDFSEDEKKIIKQWLEDYKTAKEEQIDQVSINRHRDASLNLAMILVGLPLYLYHWRIIKRETKE